MPFEQWVERGLGDSLAKADAILAMPAREVGEKLPRLTEAMIQAACDGHYGKGYNIDGVDLSVNGRNWSFREGFQRMWAGIRKQQRALSATSVGEAQDTAPVDGEEG